MQPLNIDRLARDLHTVMLDVEDLLQATAGNANEKLSATRARVEASLRSAKESIASAQGHVRAQVSDAVRSTENYVHEHPWRAIGTAVGIGVLIGLIVQTSANFRDPRRAIVVSCR